MNARRLILAALAVLCTMTGGLLFSGTAAQAALTHDFVGSFGVAGAGSGAFSDPLGVAVDQSTGDLYVYEAKYVEARESNVPLIYKFNAAGEPEDFSGLGSNVIEGSGEVYGRYSQIAVDSSSGPDAGDIYAVEAEHVTVYGADGDRLGELNSGVEADGGPWGFACGVAVDPAGNVYVGLYEGHVDKYTPTGSPVGNSDYVSSLAGLPEGSCNLAADAEGNVYVTSEEGPVTKYEALQFGSLAASGTVIAEHGSTVAIDPAPSDDDLYVDEGSDIAEYDSSGDLQGKFGASGAGVLSGASNGVAVNHSSGEVYVSNPAEEDGKGLVNIYGPGIVVPDVSLEPVSALLAKSVTLNGTVNPDNEGTATCEFQYATSESYEETGSYDQTVPCSQSIPSGNSPVPVTANVSGLTPNTTYHYRLDATNGNGANDSEDATFTTTGPPTVVSESSEGIGHYSATIKAQINPGGLETHYHFEYGTSESYDTSTPIPDGTIPAGFSEKGVSANLTGLAIGTTYHFRVVATNADSPTPVYGPDQTFTTVPPALIEEESVSDVAGTSATLQAMINPLGNDTHYYFQYGATSCTASPSSCTDASSPPGTDIGSEAAYLSVSTHIQGLTSDTVYYYRVVAVNALGTFYSTDYTFTTQHGGEEFVLPDGRAWELVSPPTKDGALPLPLGEEDVQASDDGDAITYSSLGPMGANSPASNLGTTQVLSVRGSGGWSSENLSTPVTSLSGVTAGGRPEYQLFSSDLSVGLLDPPSGSAPLAPEASATEKTLYLRDDTSGGYLPLVTPTNVPPGTKFGESTLEAATHYVTLEGATPDLSHVVIGSTEALTSNAVKEGNQSNLYEWAGGQLQLVSVLPDGQPADEASLGANLGDDENAGTTANVRSRNAVSNDGSLVFWSTSGSEGRLFVRDTVRDETLEVDQAQGVTEPSSHEAIFQTASGDGSRVFFTDGQKLTANSTANERNGRDLYMFEMTSGGSEPLAGKLTDLTVDEHAGEDANVQQDVLGASEDGSYVYFVATGVLSSAETAGHEKAVSGADNLYVLHDTGTEWTTTFIAALSKEDEPDWELNSDGLSSMTSRVASNGRYVAFMSDRSLTGYDNLDANSGQPDEEVFLYDASANRLVCASCNPTGARPVGVYDHEPGPPLVDRLRLWSGGGGRWLAGLIPGWTKLGLITSIYQSRYLSNSGRLFFDSSDALVPEDTNGKEDVYEYEPEGVGSCTGASATFDTHTGGCVGLISSGTSDEESVFLDASENGDDVFFLTAERLVPEDYDTAYDVYDAHVCSEAAPCQGALTSPPACTTTDSCRAAPSPQPAIFGAPPSATFSGGGNLSPSVSKPNANVKSKPLTRAQKRAKALTACKKQKRKKRKRAACEAKARKRYAAKPGAKKSDQHTEKGRK